MHEITKKDLVKLTQTIYEIPQFYRSDMRVAARMFANDAILDDIMQDRSLWQLVNTATLPGIVKYALAMPDIHQGYGFPIGGVVATDIQKGGVISPGGIGYDINCGVRLLATSLTKNEIKPYLEKLSTELFNTVPSGVGESGRLKLSRADLDKVLSQGAHRMLELGYGQESDIEKCEEHGRMHYVDVATISDQAKKRGLDQLGTLGSGNHFLEVQYIQEIFDNSVAQVFGLRQDGVVVMIHCGSRGLGHQVCTDYVRRMMLKAGEWNIILPDKELVCAPFTSQEAQDYFSAMKGAANFAWANRHMISHWVREAFHKIIGKSVSVAMVYDLSHNIGKKETHSINGKKRELIIHRKGATRSFPAGRQEVPEIYKHIGHPVLIPGTMGTSSYVLVGTQEALEQSFGSSCHGAGRRISRAQAKKTVQGSRLRQELKQQNIIVRCESNSGLVEEAPEAYKNVEDVVDVIEKSGLARKIARCKPMAVIKGG